MDMPARKNYSDNLAGGEVLYCNLGKSELVFKID
jgi:hypothetical protein